MPGDEEQRPVYQEEYAHGTWKAEATIFEQQLARKLYDQQLVRQAGQTALSKVSTLLVRYNRLKLLEQDMKDDFRGDRKEAKESLENTLAAIEKQRAELDKITDAADRQKAADALKKQEDAAKERYDKRIAAIDKAVAGMEAETLKTDMDRDIDGGIRSALMLGGKAEGGRGYNLSTAGTDDTVKAGLYIDEVAGNEGNLFDQMGLLENAVNTGTLNNGTVVEEEDENGEKQTVRKGKIHDLRDVLTNMTEEDYARMNKDIHGDLGFSYEALNTFRTSGDLATKMGEAKETSFNEDLFKERETKEAKERRKGSHVGVFKKMYHHFFGTTRQANMGTKMTNTSWLGDFGTIPDRIKKNNYEVVDEETGEKRQARTNAEKREAARERASKFFSERGIELNYTENDEGEMTREDKDIATWDPKKLPKKKLTGNEADSFESLGEKVRPKDLDALVMLQDAGFIRSAEGEYKQSDDGNSEQLVQKLSGDKSARNMMTAFKLLGADENQLLQFRLALIAYMVPTGKKTLWDILEESKESDVPATGIDMSEPGLMYKTFVENTKTLLGTDITKEEEDPKKDKDKGKKKVKDAATDQTQQQPAQQQAQQPEAPKGGLRLPMEIVREYIEKEKRDRLATGAPLSNFRGGQEQGQGSHAPDRPLPPIPQQTQEQQEPLNPAEHNDGGANAESLDKFKNVFGDLSSEAREIFAEGEMTDKASRFAEKIRRNVASEEKMTILRDLLDEMSLGIGGGDDEAFWQSFIGTFGSIYMKLTIGSIENAQYGENTDALIEFLKNNDSDFKELIMRAYDESQEI